MYVDDLKLAAKKQNIDPMWKIPMKDVDLGQPTSCLDHVYWECTQRECQISKDIVDNYKIMFESRISCGAMGNYQKLELQGNLTRTLSLHGPITWKVMQRNACKDLANWRIKQLNNYTRSKHHALTTTYSRKKKWDLLDNCQKYALKLL